VPTRPGYLAADNSMRLLSQKDSFYPIISTFFISQHEQLMSNNKIYLCNLNKTVTETLLQDHFSGYGKIIAVSLPLDPKSQAPKGYAFITFDQEGAAEKALEQDGQLFLDQDITVQIATERQRKISSPQ
jgi:RNA recognition motif-containing protein